MDAGEIQHVARATLACQKIAVGSADGGKAHAVEGSRSVKLVTVPANV